jgi:hypothetical protein
MPGKAARPLAACGIYGRQQQRLLAASRYLRTEFVAVRLFSRSRKGVARCDRRGKIADFEGSPLVFRLLRFSPTVSFGARKRTPFVRYAGLSVS